MAPTLIRTFPVEGKPVRVISADGWRDDEEYADDADIQEVVRVTWGDYLDLESGWIADIVLYEGGWAVSEDEPERYASVEEAATAAVLQWVAYEKTLTPADYRRLFDKYVETLKNPDDDIPVILESVMPRQRIPRFSQGTDYGTDMYVLVSDIEDGRQLIYAPGHSYMSGYGQQSYAPTQVFMRELDRERGFWVVKGTLPGRLSEKTFRDNAHDIDAFFGIPELAAMVEPDATVTITRTKPTKKGVKVKRRNNPHGVSSNDLVKKLRF